VGYNSIPDGTVSQICEIPRKFELAAVQGHQRSSTLLLVVTLDLDVVVWPGKIFCGQSQQWKRPRRHRKHCKDALSQG